MVAGPARHLLRPLARSDRRVEAARELARLLGADDVLLYVRDAVLGVMLPAPGMPKTVPGGPAWRAFLRRCLREPRVAGTVDLPAGCEVQALAIAQDGAALILLGARAPDAASLDEVEGEFPLLAALLVAEQQLQIERAEAAEARDAASRAHDLAQALDRARAASAELNLQLRHEHERKDEFLAMLAHELRNPLSPLVNSIELLRRTAGTADDRTVLQLEVMARQLQQLTRLVDDLLDVSRVSRGLIELRRERLPLEEVLDDAVEAVRPLLEARSHALVRTGLPPHVGINGDRVRLTQVFANLLGNAAKYTDPGGRIVLSAVVDQHRVSVVVQDNGIGIPQDMLGRVFDMFMQIPGARSRSLGGLGIGLTLARRLVELHGGRLSAYSRGEGQGSTFTLSLPHVALPAPPAVRSPPPAPRREEPPGAQARVLVVDDNRDGADTLAALLDMMGAQVRVAHDGQQALDAAAAFLPDLVLLDIGLPGMDGYETARRLRQQAGSQPRVVALTGYGAPQDRERALEAGFDEHLVKPVLPGVMQALLQQLAALREPS
jgi:signal transduction histidine kinase/ActR/RegA family two-component response regulator